MLFAELPLAAALGKIAAHTLRLDTGPIKKGTVLIQDDIDALRAAGIETVYVAQAEAGEISEDDAVDRIARRVAGNGVDVARAATGRCNLYAAVDGVLHYDPAQVDAANSAAPALNILALRNGDVVRGGQLIAQIKAIPYVVAESMVEAVCALANTSGLGFAIRPFTPVRCGLLQTRLPGTRDTVLDKTRAVLAGKLQRWQALIDIERRCAHTEAAIADALSELAAHDCGLLLVVGATATTDERDVVPSAIRLLDGTITQIGVPLEPGTLLGVGSTSGGRPILILPGSLRSPVASSFDVIAPSLLTGLRLTRASLRCFGAGGLLKALPPERPDRKRSRPDRAARVAAVVLAAGLGRRMGEANKLLVDVDGRPLIGRVLETVLASRADQVIVVVGHDADRLRPFLENERVTIVENPDYADGMSGSLSVGIDALADNVDAALVCLGDMPFLTSGDLDRIIASYELGGARHICVPEYDGRQGNPVLWGREYFGAIKLLQGDHGAKKLLAAYAEAVISVPVDALAILRDIDTPEDLDRPDC